MKMASKIKYLLPLAGMILVTSPASGNGEYGVGMVRRADIDNNGEVSRAEYDQAFERKMKAKIEWLDINGDGVVSPEEFRDQHKAEYENRWQSLDTDGDGVVKIEELPRRGKKGGSEFHKDF